MEVWKSVKDYEGIYEVSNYGNVKSLERMINHSSGKLKMKIKERILKPQKQGGGYFFVSLYKNNIYKRYPVHQLVAIEFLGYIKNKNNKIVVDHIDFNIKNNLLSNLQLITNRENVSRSKKSNTGESNIYYNKKYLKYNIKIQTKGITINSGGFKNINDAILAKKEIFKKHNITNA